MSMRERTSDTSVLDAMRARTAELHAKAERSGIVGSILDGSVQREPYALFLRNLAPAYGELEDGLERHRDDGALGELRRDELRRSPAIGSDLTEIAGADWEERLPLLPEGIAYARRVADAGLGDGALLIAHAYTRYLGDLAGGQILRARLGASAALQKTALAFYEFPGISDPRGFGRAYRAALDAAAQRVTDREALLREAVLAFELNIRLSDAVEAWAVGSRRAH